MGLAFKLLKRSCKIGDRVILTSSTGTSEGVIFDIDDVEVALQLDDGGFSTMKADDIVAMKTVEIVALENRSKSQVDEPVKTPSVMPEETVGDTKSEVSPESSETNINEIPHDVPIITENSPEKESSKMEAEPVNKQKAKSLSLDNLLSTQWKNTTWKRQTYRKMLSAFEKLGDYHNNVTFKKSLPSKGQISPNTRGIIIDSLTGSKHIYNTEDLLLPRQFYSSAVYFTKEGSSLKNILPARKIEDIIGFLENILKKELLGSNPKLPVQVVSALSAAFPNIFELSLLFSNLDNIIYSFGIDAKPARYEGQRLEHATTLNSPSQIANSLTTQRRHEEALPYYLEAIEKGDNTVRCIHQAASAFLTLYKKAQKSTGSVSSPKAEKLRNEGIEFMKINRRKLPDEEGTFFLLENFYYSIRDYKNFLDILPQVMIIDRVKTDISMLSTYLNKKATALIAEQKLTDAQYTINEALRVNPDNVGAQRIQDVLDKLSRLNEQLEHADEKEAKEIKEELEKIRATDFSSFTEGDLGIFITKTIEDYSEMEGLPEFVKANKEYNEQTLRTLRRRIEEAGKSRPGDRAKWTLTEVKLMQLLDIENDKRTIHGEMAQYCQAMAELSLYQSDWDVARFYYDQSFALQQSSDTSSDKYISVYLQTIAYNQNEAINEIFKATPPINEMLPRVITDEMTPYQWEILIELLLYNKNVASKIVPCLYGNTELRLKSMEMFKRFDIRQPDGNSESDFIKAWDKIREKRIHDRRRVTIQIRSFGESCNKLEDVSTNIATALEACRKEEWIMGSLDFQRLGGFLDTILNPIRTYLECSGYLNKLNARNNINSQIRAMQTDISKRPTKLSFEAILPLLSRVQELVEDAFNTVLLTSKPEITISLPANETVIERNNIVSLQVKISNGKDSSPVSNVTVEIKDENGVKPVENNAEETGIQIEGGKSFIFRRRIEVNDDVIKNKATSIVIVCRYRDREDKWQEAKDSRPLTLYSRENFTPIVNPYKAGDKLSSTDPTFKGRTKDIKEVVDSIEKVGKNEPGKQIIIYGQKRCGKSSVLERIKTHLERDGYFCIEFSLEQLSKTINEFTFYHEILKALGSKLRLLARHKNDQEVIQRWGNEIPEFEIPKIKDFEEEDPYNPSNTFIEYMAKFRNACYGIPRWKDCKVVLMIDEFTAIYAGVESGRIDNSIMKQWKAITQKPDCNFSVVLVGQDVTPSFMNKPYAANAFRIIEGRRLTYLPSAEARELVEEPMTKANGGESPYIGKSIDRIIEYTSRNPYYIQLMCTKLIQYINEHHLKKVTEADVDDLADIMKYELDDGTFDNLINAGEEIVSEEYQARKAEILSVLTALAKLSKGRGYDYCSNDDIEAIKNKEKQKGILEELYEREVLEKKEDRYKIQVRLFKEWLLR